MRDYEVPDQQIDPPEMKKADEKALELADDIYHKINKIHDYVESFFDELSIDAIEKKLAKAEYYLEELENLSNERSIVDEDYEKARWLVEDIEGWLHEKEESEL